jgi:hypothetical protein
MACEQADNSSVTAQQMSCPVIAYAQCYFFLAAFPFAGSGVATTFFCGLVLP